MIELGNEKIEESLDLVKIIKDLRNFEILVSNSILNNDALKLLNHSRRNVIDLDEEY